ncbi:MAG: hypothetical protein JXA18_03540, partial [Chitinispirillaceae bacterium]|nr:hypothetical protein [Chitinispirillaceae bacterium]
FSLDRGRLRIVSDRMGDASIRLLSIDGRSIASLSTGVNQGTNSISVEVSERKSLNNGIYLVKYSINGKYGTQLLAVNR